MRRERDDGHARPIGAASEATAPEGGRVVPRVCTVCQHAERGAIDEALVRRDSFRGIARRFAVSPDAVERHAKAHLPAAIVKAREAEDVANGDALLRQIQDLQKRTLNILAAAEKDDGDARVALVAIHQARENVAFLLKLLAELRPPPTAADARAFAEKCAAVAGVSVDELLAEAERIAREVEGPQNIEVRLQPPEPRKPDA